jgi:peptide/nickel transport system ATP-binding protein
VSPLVEVADLEVRFGRRSEPVVSGVSFSVEPGECVALVGESGSGKSVTARTLLGMAGDGSSVRASTLRFGTVDLQTARRDTLRRLRGTEIGLVTQDALVALDPLRPVGREIEDALRLHTPLRPAERRKRVLDALREVGVSDPEVRAAQRSGELSGGLRQRALLASALALRPRLLIADEPTTALDATVQAGILRLLERIRLNGTAILLISHDLAVVRQLANTVTVMRAGTVIEQGDTHTVLTTPQHPYTRELIAAVPANRPRGTRLTLQNDVLPPPSPPAVGSGHRTARAASGPMVEARGLVRRFGERLAVDNVSLTLSRGRTLGLVGESGSGKSTIARLILALDRPDAGQVEILGRPWSAVNERDRRANRPRIGAIYQDPLSSFDPRLTVGQILADAATGGRTHRAALQVPPLLEQVGLSPSIAGRRPRHLSGGQRQRVAIARAIAPRPDILICDEPVSSLDVSVQAQVLDLLDELQRRLGLSYLFISHDLGVVRHMSDEVAVLRDGRVVEHGDTERIFTAPQHEYTRTLVAAALTL